MTNNGYLSGPRPKAVQVNALNIDL